MKITWLGHACFKIEGEKTTVLIDPYNSEVGYPVRKTAADYVTVSHKHPNHNDLSWVEGAKVIDKPGTTQFDDITFNGILAYHDEQTGAQRGENIIFKFTVDGVTVCHLGDLGHLPDDKLWRAIGRADVLMVPVGGLFTIDAKTAAKVVKMIEPTVAIPMHYNTGMIKFPLAKVDEFLELTGGRKISESTIEVAAGNFDAYRGVVAMEWAR